jgi:DNA-binding transcriptional LysR family regulator
MNGVRHLNLHALRLFYHVAESGSVTLASEALNISQPAVTSQIKKLEREIGLRLFSPKGRGILLTEAGHKLAIQARRLFALEQEVENTIANLKNGVFGTLHIAATYLPANFLLPQWIAQYKQAYPSIDIELTTTNSSAAIDLLLNYKTEIAFIGGILKQHPLLHRKEWIKDEMCFVVHKHHPLANTDAEVSLEEILREPFVFREQGSYAREQLFSLCRVHNLPAPIIGLQMNGLNETIKVVMAGYGVTFLSALEINDYVKRGDVKRLQVKDVQLINHICLYTRKETLNSPSLQFIDTLRGLN